MSLYVCGALTVAHFESSKSIFSALVASSRMNFQPGLKLNVARGDAGGMKRVSAARSGKAPTKTTAKKTKGVFT